MCTVRWRWTMALLACVLPAEIARAAEHEAIIAEARALAADGRFSDAESLLRRHVPDPNAPISDPVAIELEILRRTRLDFRVTPDELFAQLAAQIPDLKPDDVERYREEGLLLHRVVDGEVRYFNRAAGNLFHLSEAASARRTPPVKRAGGFDRAAHIVRLLALADASGKTEVDPVRHRVRYQIAVKEGHPRLRPGAKVRCWMPFPQEYRQQRDVRLIRAEPEGAVIAPSGTPQRTLYFETTVSDANVPPKFAMEVEFVTSAVVPKLDPNLVKPYDTTTDDYRTFTAERPPHIVFTPEVRKLVAEIVGDETNPLIRARRIFRWVYEHLPWVGEMEYSTIPSLSAKGLAARAGDCGVQGMTFITLCRAAGIPARWQSGWSSEPGDENMHDWSEILLEPWGWLPADVSWGVVKHPDPRVQEFYCGGLEAYRFIVNLDFSRELHPPKTSFRSEPVDFQRGEVEIDGHNLYFDEWRWDFDVTTTPLEGGIGALEETFDALVPRLLAAENIPGAVLAVGQRVGDRWETWQQAYGWFRTEPRREPMPANAIFDLASMTKPIAVGTSMMMLVEQGKLQLDDPVSKFIPEFADGEKAGVLVRHLLTHTSGLPPYVDAKERERIVEVNGVPCGPALRAHIHGLKLLGPPGTQTIYSCLNAVVAGEIVERVSGEPLDKFCAGHVFGPLELVDTAFLPPKEKWPRCVPTTRGPLAHEKGSFLQGEVHDPLALVAGGVSGNAGLFSTAADVARFARMMLDGGELGGVRILKPETVHAMLSVQNDGAPNREGKPDRRGLMWDLYVPDPGDKGVDRLFAAGHTGYTGTAFRIYPGQGAYVVALTNRVHPDDKAKVEQFRQQVWKTVGELLLGAKD